MVGQRTTDEIEQSRYVQILIAPQGRKWLVKYKDQERVFADWANARKIAVQFAHESGQSGSPARVVLRRSDGKLIPIWVFGRDDPPE